MSEVHSYRLKPPAIKAAPYDEVYDALQTIKTLIDAKSTKVDSITQQADFTVSMDGEDVNISVPIGSMVIKSEEGISVMSKDEFNEIYESY